MKYYLVRDWTNVDTNGRGQIIGTTKATDKYIDEEELWNILNAARSDNRKIAVFEVGKCLIDWS